MASKYPMGQWFRLKSDAQEKASEMRTRGHCVIIRKYRYGKGRKGLDGKGDLGWMASWSERPLKRRRGRIVR